VYGDAFEHWVILEFHRLNEYLQKDYRLSYLRTKDGAEIDLLLTKPGKPTLLIEIKSAERLDPVEVNKLARLRADVRDSQAYFLSRDETAQELEGVRCLHWRRGLEEIFGLGAAQDSNANVL
jgi:predicted AAA+ superfamily ATPase